MSGAWILTGSTGILLPAVVGWGPLGRAETKSEVSGGASGRLHCSGGNSLDPLPFLAQDCKACLCSSWLILRCQESVEVKNPKGGWEETFLCLLTDFDLEQMLCQKEAVPPCAGTVSGFTRC